MNKKIKIIFISIIFIFCFNLVLQAQGYRIAIVISRPLTPYNQAIDGIKEVLEEKMPGCFFDYYQLEGETKSCKKYAKKINDLQTDIVFAIGTEAAIGIAGEIGDIPLIVSMVYEPIGDLISKKTSLDNIYTLYLKVSFQQQFFLLKEIMPKIETVSIIYPKSKRKQIEKESIFAAQKVGLNLKLKEIKSMEQFDVLLNKAKQESDGIFMILDQEIYGSSSTKKLLLFSARNKFPVFSFSPNYVKAGALISFSADYVGNGKRAARVAIDYLDDKKVTADKMTMKKIVVSFNKGIAKVFGIKLSSDNMKRIDKIF